MHGSSKKAMSHNIAAEQKAGKPKAQSIAIAYNIAKRNKKAKGGMIGYDDGGNVQNEKLNPNHEPVKPEEVTTIEAEQTPSQKMSASFKKATGPIEQRANGGEIEDHDAEYAHHVAMAIHHKKQMMAEGGMVMDGDHEGAISDDPIEMDPHQIGRHENFLSDEDAGQGNIQEADGIEVNPMGGEHIISDPEEDKKNRLAKIVRSFSYKNMGR